MSDFSASYLDDENVYPLNKVIFCVFLILLSCVFIPCALLSFGMQQTPLYFLIPAFAVLAGGIVFLFVVLRRVLFSVLISVILFFLYSYTQSPVIPAFIMAILLSFALCAFVTSICTKKMCWVLVLIPIASYLGAYILCGDLVISAFAVLPLASGTLMGVLQRRKAERSTIIASGTVGFIVLLCGVLALYLYTRGNLSAEYIKGLIAGAKSSTSEYMKTLTLELDEASAQLFTPEILEAYITNTFNLLPGYVVCGVMIILYFIHTVQLSLYRSLDFDLILNESSSKISMSIYAACLFVISFIMSLSTDSVGNPDIVGVVFGNLFLILAPGLFVVGMDAFGVITKKLRRLGFFFIVLIIAAVFMFSQYIVRIIAAVGAVYIIVTTIDRWAQKHYSKKDF